MAPRAMSQPESTMASGYRNLTFWAQYFSGAREPPNSLVNAQVSQKIHCQIWDSPNEQKSTWANKNLPFDSLYSF